MTTLLTAWCICAALTWVVCLIGFHDVGRTINGVMLLITATFVFIMWPFIVAGTVAAIVRIYYIKLTESKHK